MYRLNRTLWGFGLLVLIAAHLTPPLFARQATARQATTPPVRFDHLTTADGLPENSVMAMLQDTLGFLWLGTQNGLVRYDGVEMTTFAPDLQDPHSLGGRTIRSLHEDHRGNLWIGTFLGGVSHFDRATERFTTYRHDPDDPHSLSHNSVLLIHEDRAGQLWLLTGDGTFSYLNRLDPATGAVTRYHPLAGDMHSLSHPAVTEQWIGNKGFFAFLEDRAGRLWVGTHAGLNRYDPATDGFAHYRHDPKDPRSLRHDAVASVFEDRRGRLWVGTNGGGLHRYDPATDAFIAYQHDPADPNSLAHDVAAVFFEDRAGQLWVTTADGLDRFDPETGRFTHFRYRPAAANEIPFNVFVPIAETPEGDLWLLSGQSSPADLNRDDGEGDLFRLDPATGIFTRYPDDPEDPQSFKGRLVSSYLTDRSGVFWLGSWIGGLNKVDRAAARFTRYAHAPGVAASLRHNRIWSIHEAPAAPGVLWIGTQTGLDRFDRATGRFTHVPTGASASQGVDPIFALHQDRAGDLWIGTRLSGLLRRDRRTGQITRFMQSPDRPDDPRQLGGRWVHALLEDRAGLLWIGTEGLDRYDPATGTFTHFRHIPDDPTSLRHDGVEVLYEDREGTLWVGADNGGLGRFDPATETFTTYYDAATGPISVHALLEDAAGRFWVGDALTGLHRFDRATGTSRAYTVHDGLAGNAVFGIEEDAQGSLWLSTDRGLSRFEPETETFRTFSRTDGSGLFRSATGTLFVASDDGLIAFDPEQLGDNPHPPQVALRGVRLFNEPLAFGPDAPLEKHSSQAERLTLPHDANDLTFEYAALHYVRPEANRYQYRLDGYEAVWRDVGTQRAAIYPNLPPGDYAFRVRAANSDGVWNAEGASLPVTVLPPWWRTGWAYLLYGLMVLGGILAVDRVQRRRLIRHEREQARRRETRLQAAAAEEKAALMARLDEMKTRFFVNVSHEFRTSLTLILGPLDDALGGSLSETLRVQLALMQRNGARLLRLINELLDLSRLESGSMTLRAQKANMVSFLRRIVGLFATRAERKDITLRFEASQAELDLYFEPDKLEKVFVNLLSNAFKFTPAGGTIDVHIGLTRTDRPDDDGAIEVVVRDTGDGIPAADLPHVFDRFRQVKSSTTPEQEGTGIGLALVKELVALHGGTIRVESTLGAGTTFRVRLPSGTAHLGEAELLDEGGAEAALEALEALPPEVAGLEASLRLVDAMAQAEAETSARPDAPLILIAEDHDDLRAYLHSQLALRYRVAVAADGVAALALARAHPPALIISDVMMPRMDGYTLCRTVKSDPALGHIPVVLLTARADEESKVEGLETGADDYLYKPFSAAELLVRVENLIEIRRRLRQRFSREVVAVSPSEIELSTAEADFLERLQEVVEHYLGNNNFSVEWLADEMALSKRQLQRKVHALTGLSAAGYIRTLRLQRAAQRLAQGSETVAEVAHAVGFQKVPHFSKLFRQVFGVPPSQYPPTGA